MLESCGARCSMSAAGNCYDNAVAESFFATLKKEFVHGCSFEKRAEAYHAISHFIENFYNAKWLHFCVLKRIPNQLELANSGQLAPSSHQQAVLNFRVLQSAIATSP